MDPTIITDYSFYIPSISQFVVFPPLFLFVAGNEQALVVCVVQQFPVGASNNMCRLWLTLFVTCSVDSIRLIMILMVVVLPSSFEVTNEPDSRETKPWIGIKNKGGTREGDYSRNSWSAWG